MARVDAPGSLFCFVLLHGGDLLSSYSEGMECAANLHILYASTLGEIQRDVKRKTTSRRNAFPYEDRTFAIVRMQDLLTRQQAHAGMLYRDKCRAAAQLSEAE